MTKRALISVSDKTGVTTFAAGLVANGFEIISTGGTRTVLEEAGVPTLAIDDITGFPEMLDGRVKTLHPNIHGGLLAKRGNQTHQKALTEQGIQFIDLVVVNLYPFKETILKPAISEAEAIEMIDIGGPSMLRSAAKNYQDVTAVVDPSDYEQVLSEISSTGTSQLATRKRLAAKVFRHTAAYDALIADYLTTQVGETEPEKHCAMVKIAINRPPFINPLYLYHYPLLPLDNFMAKNCHITIFEMLMQHSGLLASLQNLRSSLLNI